MTTHQVTYEGPASLAMTVATQLADAEGINLTSADKRDSPDGSVGAVRLVLTVDGTTDAVDGAVAAIDAGLPEGARITSRPQPA